MPQSHAFAAFQYSSFRWFQIARFISVIAIQVQGVAIAWQVYALTRNPLDLGYVGLAQFIPALVLSLVAGQVADRVNRQRIVLVCYACLAMSAAGLMVESSRAEPSLAIIYSLLVLVGVARAFLGPAGAALMPNLIPPEVFPNAVAWSSSTWQVATVVGPALGGIAYGALSAAPRVYAVCAGMFVLALGVMLGVRASSGQRDTGRASWSQVLAGLTFVWNRKLILGAISLDLFAVLLGGAVALLPIYANDILHVGPWGLGLLRSAPGAGAAVMAVALAWFPIRRRAGWLLFLGVAVFGLATIVFGLSENMMLSVAALVVLGASDMVSVYVRQTVVQLNTPDAMRGRVSAVNLVFIGASNELGELESGLTAHWLGTVRAVVFGGIGTLVIVALWLGLFPELRKVDSLTAKSAQS